MKNVICCGLVAVVLALSVAASAQDRKMDDKMVKGIAGDAMGGTATFSVKSIKMVGPCSQVIAW